MGLGGLGHVAVRIAVALGAEVSVISRSGAKRDDALALGAASYVATEEGAAWETMRGSFDLVVNTVSSAVDLSELLWSVRPLGVLANLGLPTDNYSVHPYALVNGSRVLAGSNIGGVRATQEMLDFCADRGIAAQIETIDATDPSAVDDAYRRVVAGAVRYRAVIDTATIPTDGALVTDAG